MSIQEHLNKIRNAIYGREVRESIAKGIETAYDDASENGNANMEVKIARGTHPNLRSRLDEVDNKQQQTTEHLAQKVGYGVRAELEDLSPTVLSAIEGGEGTEFNLLSEPAHKSVTVDKLAFADSVGLALSYERGFAGGADSYMVYVLEEDSRSVFYLVEPNTTYTISKELSDRFRILSSTDYPSPEANFVRYIKQDNTTPDESKDSVFTFTTKENENYLIVTVSRENQEPRISLRKGSKPYDFNTLNINDNVSSANIRWGKNLFNGEYIEGGIIGGVAETVSTFRTHLENSRSIVLPVEKNADYSIYKTITNRFRVALSHEYPYDNSNVKILKDETVEGGDEVTSFSLNSGVFNYLIVTVCAYELDIPDFVQIEKSSHVTELETFGYELTPRAEPLRMAGDIGVRNDKVSIEEFRISSDSDSQTVQRAFDNSGGSIVSFDSGRTYNLDSTVTAHAKNVRGIEGNNALLNILGDFTGLRYHGSKLSGTSSISDPTNELIEKNEMNSFIERLRVTSRNKYQGVGIEVEGMFGFGFHDNFVYKLKRGFIINGNNRDFIITKNIIRDNSEVGLMFNEANIHQLNMASNHISYNKNNIQAIDCVIANWQMVGDDLENSISPVRGNPESIISIITTEDGESSFWEINWVGLTVQDHGYNTKPLINIDLKSNELLDFVFSTSTIGNSSNQSVPIYINGGRGVGLNNLSFGGSTSSHDIVLGQNTRFVRVTGNKLQTGVDYEDVTKLIISNNTYQGTPPSEVNDGNVLIVNNL